METWARSHPNSSSNGFMKIETVAFVPKPSARHVVATATTTQP
jgi:hypothetical protein